MQDETNSFNTTLSGLRQGPWLNRLAEIAQERGAFDALGAHHFAAFVRSGDTLLMTFETIGGMRALSDTAAPLGWELVTGLGWSHLCLASDGDTWFRDEDVYEYVDALIDDGFFDDFEQVIFYGAGPCAYAAAAFSVASPGATVLAVQPQATLDPRITGWDTRFTYKRRTEFRGRFGYAPDMVDASAQAFVVFDPKEPLDAMHAALFRRPNVVMLRTPHMGDAIQTHLIDMQILFRMLAQASAGKLSQKSFAALWRGRRSYPPYLRNLMSTLENPQRSVLLKALCRNVTARMKAPRFARRLKELAEAQSRKAATDSRKAAPTENATTSP